VKYGAKAFVAHNGRNFDIPFILDNMKRREDPVTFSLPIIDSKEDVKYPEMFKQRDLISLAALHGFLNPFPHNALSDVFTMMKVVQGYSFEETFAYAQEPDVCLIADVTFATKEKAKAARFMWQSAGKFNIPGQWIKSVKQSKVDEEMSKHPFRVLVAGGKLL
jgi:DNA polymerase-3 subunit epsilon